MSWFWGTDTEEQQEKVNDETKEQQQPQQQQEQEQQQQQQEQEQEIEPEYISPDVPTPVTKEEFQQLAEKKLAEFLALLDINNGWSLVDFSSEAHPDLRLWEKIVDESAIHCVRASLTMPFPPHVVRASLASRDVNEIKQWDPDCLEIKVQEIDTNLEVMVQTFWAPFPLQNREFLVIRYFSTTPSEDGEIINVVGCSINWKSFPLSDSMVRAILPVGGWQITPIRGNENQCLVSRVLQVNPKGLIPAFIVNMFKHKAALAMASLKECLDRQYNKTDNNTSSAASSGFWGFWGTSDESVPNSDEGSTAELIT